MKTIIRLMLAGLIGVTGLQMAVAESAVGAAAEDVGMLEVSVQVDGLSCPFLRLRPGEKAPQGRERR